MVDLYNETGEKEGISGMKAIHVELKGEDGELDGRKFDVIIVSTILTEIRCAQQPDLTSVGNSVTWHITTSKTWERCRRFLPGS